MNLIIFILFLYFIFAAQNKILTNKNDGKKW